MMKAKGLRFRFLLFFLGIFFIVALAPFTALAQEGASPPPTPTSAPDFDYGRYFNEEEGQAVEEESVTSLLLGLSWKLGIVLVLAYGVLWVMRRFVTIKPLATGKRLQVLESLPLGGNGNLHLVRCDGKVLLIGATAQSLNMLTEITAESGDGSPVLSLESENEDSPELLPPRSIETIIAPNKLTEAQEAIRSIRQLWNRASVKDD